MKFFHLADLHFGKNLYGVSMIDHLDQPVWVDRFLALAREEKPDAVIIAGDVYDRSAPSGDAMELLNRMITDLSEQGVPVLMVAGNHDSGQRLSFAGDLLAKENVYIAGTLEKKLKKVTLSDEYGPVNFYLLPYVFPALVAEKFEDEDIRDYASAVKRILMEQDVDFGERNVLIAHQNVTCNGKEAERGGSETMVGGVGEIDFHTFDGFDYVALGHIHSSYPVGRETVRYAGSPLCYHFNETKQATKGPVLVSMGKKMGDSTEIDLETKMLKPLHPMREIKGTIEEVRGEVEKDRRTGEYLRVVITDEKITPAISDFLRGILEKRESVLMELVSEYQEVLNEAGLMDREAAREKPIEEVFAAFYRDRKAGMEPDEEEKKILHFAGELERKNGREGLKEAEDKEALNLLSFVLSGCKEVGK